MNCVKSMVSVTCFALSVSCATKCDEYQAKNQVNNNNSVFGVL